MSTHPDAVWGTNPYPGRVIIRQLWMADSIDAARAVLARRDELLDAYEQAYAYVHPDASAGAGRDWAIAHYERRTAEVHQKFMVDTPENHRPGRVLAVNLPA